MAMQQIDLFAAAPHDARSDDGSVRAGLERAEKQAEQYVTEGERIHAREDFLAGWDAVGVGAVDMDAERIRHTEGKYPDIDDQVAGRLDFEAGWRARVLYENAVRKR